jgi:hypothetical protein
MKTLAMLIGLGLAAGGTAAQSSHYVKPHVTRNGTYVEGHQQTNPDSSRLNNWSSQGNINPYTGQAGTVDPFSQPQQRQQQYAPQQPGFGQTCGYMSSGRYVCR